MSVRVAPRRITPYQMMLYLGCVAGTYAGAAVASRDDLVPWRFVVTTVLLIAVAIAGSRWLYPWLTAGRVEGPASKSGGMALFGGLTLSLMLSVPLLVGFDLDVARFWDAAAVTMLVGLFFTRIGCTLTGCCCGRSTASRFGIRMTDVSGSREPRVPTQPIEMAFALVALSVVIWLRTWRMSAGATAAAVVAGYALLRLIVQRWRAQQYGNRERWVIVVLCVAATSAMATIVR